MGMTYSRPKYEKMNSSTYLKTIYLTDDMEGFCEEIRSLVKVFKNGDKEFSLLGYGTSKSIVYSKDFLIFYSLFQDFLNIDAVIDLNELRELPLTNEEKIQYFKDIYNKEDLDIEILKDTKDTGKRKVYYKCYK